HDADGLPARMPAAAQTVYAAAYDMSRFSREECLRSTESDAQALADIRAGNICGIAAEASDEPAFLVWGDSHAAAMTPGIDVAAARAGVSGLLAAHAGCPPLADMGPSDSEEAERCRTFNAAVRDLVAARHIPLVVLAAYWPKYVHESELPNQGIF